MTDKWYGELRMLEEWSIIIALIIIKVIIYMIIAIIGIGIVCIYMIAVWLDMHDDHNIFLISSLILSSLGPKSPPAK
jgi:hypothetical protein